MNNLMNNPMNNPMNNSSPSARCDWVATTALLYLLLPNLLFLWGWMEPIASIPLSLALLYGSWLIVRKPMPPHARVESTPTDRRCLAAALVLAFAWVFLSGITGNSQQSYDFFVRNPIYETLVRCDWPLFSRSGEYFIYYFAFCLPPALFSKWTGVANGNIWLWDFILMLWTYLGVALVVLLLYGKLKKHILLFFLLWICFDSFAHLGKILFDSAAFRLELLAHMEPGALSSWWNKLLTACTGTTTQLYYTYHHAVPIWLICSLLLTRLPKAAACPAGKGREQMLAACLFYSALGVLCSPLGSAGVLILLGFLFAAAWKKEHFSLPRLALHPCTLAGVALVALAVVYLSRNQGGECRLLWQESPLNSTPELAKRATSYLLSLATTLPFFLILLPKSQWCSPIWKACITIICALPHIFIGIRSNELLFKGNAPLYLLLAYLVSAGWSVTSARRRIVIIASCLVCSWTALTQLGSAVSTFGMDAHTIRQNRYDPWQGHLYHPDSNAYQQFWGAPPPYPFYRNAGQSARGLLGWVSTGRHSDTEPLPARAPRPAPARCD